MNDRRIVAITLILFTAAAPGCRRGYIEPLPGGGVVVKSDRLGWYTKKVVTRQAPETLYAEDGTICRLAPERFRETKVGALLYCNWQ